MKDITQDLVKELFNYRCGVLYWKSNHPKRPNKKAGYVDKRGYTKIIVGGKHQYAHRLIFLYHEGYLPKYVDHISGRDKGDRIGNLRECSSSQNNFNSSMGARNKSGVKGVHWCKTIKRWRAQIRVKGKQISVGSFSSLSEAEKEMKKARQRYHGEFANHG
jgi:hypothetical protein